MAELACSVLSWGLLYEREVFLLVRLFLPVNGAPNCFSGKFMSLRSVGFFRVEPSCLHAPLFPGIGGSLRFLT